MHPDSRTDASVARSAARRRGDRSAPALARRFGEALRVGDPAVADTVVDDALSAGLPATAVQSRVIGPAMHWIGELWERDAISVADEHLATALSYQALGRLYPELLRRVTTPKRRVLIAAAEGEHHVLGLRMAADALEGGGFDVRFMGADVPAAALSRWIEEHDPAVVALGVTMPLSAVTLARQLQQIHRQRPGIRLVVGGGGVPPALRHADGITFAADTERIVDDVNDALARPTPVCLDTQLTSGEAETRHSRGLPASEGVDTREARLASATAATADIARAQARRAFTLEQLAFRDPLTELWNRRAFEDRYDELLETTVPPLSTLMIDVDDFKRINDAHGHDGGDAALVRIARCVTDGLRSSDFAARYGGDEFAVLLPGAGAPHALAAGERIRSAVHAELADLGVSVSVGVNTADGDSRRRATIDADLAMYRAKQRGRNQVAVALAPTGLSPSL